MLKLLIPVNLASVRAEDVRAEEDLVNTCHTTCLFLYSLQTSETRGILMFSGGLQRDQFDHMI